RPSPRAARAGGIRSSGRSALAEHPEVDDVRARRDDVAADVRRQVVAVVEASENGDRGGLHQLPLELSVLYSSRGPGQRVGVAHAGEELRVGPQAAAERTAELVARQPLRDERLRIENRAEGRRED